MPEGCVRARGFVPSLRVKVILDLLELLTKVLQLLYVLFWLEGKKTKTTHLGN